MALIDFSIAFNQFQLKDLFEVLQQGLVMSV